jgi:hypothetical protein
VDGEVVKAILQISIDPASVQARQVRRVDEVGSRINDNRV